MPAEPVDLAKLLRQTAEAKRADAQARQISLTINVPVAGAAMVHANPWATSRILENKLADAITYTAPGGRIDVSTDTGRGDCSAVITTTGDWPAPAFQSEGDTTAAMLTPSVMGLALSQHLARALNARLVFSNEPGEGTTVRLLLPSIAGRATGPS